MSNNFTKDLVPIEVSSNEIKNFFHHWKALNEEYKKLFVGENVHLPFPDKVQKEMILKYLNPKLSKEVIEDHKNGKSYDFDDCTELKSVTKPEGVVPFKVSQIDCKRVLFMEITEDGITCYDILEKTVLDIIKRKIKEAVANGKKQVSINLHNIVMENNKMIPRYKFILGDELNP